MVESQPVRMESTSKESIWGRRSFVLITGASRGIGRTIAVEFAKQISKDSTILLLARSVPGLEETKNLILQSQSNVNVEVQSTDLSEANEQHYTEIMSKASRNISYDLYVLVHNAGTIIVDTPAMHLTDVARWNDSVESSRIMPRRYMTVNLYSATILTSSFLKLFKNKKHCIINISSLVARVPFKGLGMYCAAKASRESYFKVLAIENPSINVLNYSPGPIETDMYKITTTQCCFPDVIENFRDLKTGNRLVKVEDSIGKLINILKEQNYESGATIDYFDR